MRTLIIPPFLLIASVDGTDEIGRAPLAECAVVELHG